MEQKYPNGKQDGLERADAPDWRDGDEADVKSPPPSQTHGRRRQATGIYFGGKPVYDANKDSDWVVVLKCLMVIVICFGALIVPSMMGWGSLMTGVCMIGAPILAVLLMKNT